MGREHGHVLRREDCQDEGQRKKRRLKMTQKKQVEEESIKAGLFTEDVFGRSLWIIGVNQIADWMK